jgi:asparagine synthase (glutamine-hydrolysing)
MQVSNEASLYTAMCGILGVIRQVSSERDQHPLLYLPTIKHRGPDGTASLWVGNCFLGFHFLSMHSAEGAMQPLSLETEEYKYWLVCNGEIYNYKDLLSSLGTEAKGMQSMQSMQSMQCASDCEVILRMVAAGRPMPDVVRALNGEFAFLLLRESKADSSIYFWAARDRFGVRPLFVAQLAGSVWVASEAKAIPSGNTSQLLPDYIVHGTGEGLVNWTRYMEMPRGVSTPDYQRLAGALMEAVKVRCNTYQKIGCLLSGGLDSSIVAALLLKIKDPKDIYFFTIGLAGSRDIEHALSVAKHIGAKRHVVVTFTPEQGIYQLSDIVAQLETYDITTIRASVPQYLLAKVIASYDVRAIFSGEGSDELFAGYQYNHYAPSAEAVHDNIRMRLRQLHKYDNLRTDRTMAAASLEVRLPFLDHRFTDEVLSVRGEYFLPRARNMSPGTAASGAANQKIEKFLLRDIVANVWAGLLPDSVLWRPKDAFSDAVSSTSGESWISHLQKHAERVVDNHEFRLALESPNGPKTKEGLLYLKLFSKHYQVPRKLSYWMPSWVEATDPSATTLDKYRQ